MNIDYYHIAPIPSNFANAVQVVKTCAALKRMGVEITLFCPKGGSAAEIFSTYDVSDNFGIKFLPILRVPILGSLIFRSSALFSMMKRGKEMVYTREVGVAAIASLLGRNFIYELHAVPHKPAQRLMTRYFLRSPHLVSFVSITRGVEADFQEQFGAIKSDKRAIIPCAADVPDQAKPSIADDMVYRVGYVGHLYPGKGATIIRRLAEKHNDIEFHVVGKVEDPDLRSGIPNLIVHGPLPHVEAMAWLDRFDAVLAPYQANASAHGVVLSRWFSPLKLFEYMAHRKPIISSNLPVIEEVLTNGQNAILVEPSDQSAWSAAVTRLRDDKAYAQKMASNAYDLVKSTYSYAERAKTIIKLAEKPNA